MDVDGRSLPLVSVGVDSSKKQMLDSKREVVRKAAGKGVGLLRELAASGNAAGVKEVGVGLVGVEEDWHAAGEWKSSWFGIELTVNKAVGAKLALGTFTLKTKKDADPSKGALCLLSVD